MINLEDGERIINAIKAYFKENFDEGTHGAGQFHEARWAQPDWAFEFSVQYLIGQKRFEVVEELVSQINEEGNVSEGILADVGLIDLAFGNFAKGLDRLMMAEDATEPFYVGLVNLKMGNKQSAARELVKAISNYT